MKHIKFTFLRFLLLISFSFSFSFSLAQDDSEDEEGVVQTGVKKLVATHKDYTTRLIKGTIYDALTGKPLPGAIVKATDVEGYSALTDDEGHYELKIPVFSHSIYVSSPDYNSITLGLKKGEQQKDVKMYSTAFRQDFTETTNVMADKASDDFKYSNATNIKDEIQKQLGAYAYTTNRNGTPGIGDVIFIQGINSINVNAQPLFVVDGVILDQQYSRSLMHEGFFNDIMTTINPADIEKVTIMRNGTALYGARGANGVVFIQTKRSKSMATRIVASASVGITSKPKFIPMMDAEQYRGYASELLKTTGTRITEFKFLNTNPDYYYYNQYHNSTDWKEQVYRNGFSQNYNMNVDGGDDVASYNLSVGYSKLNSTLKYNNMDRINIRFNTDILFSSKFSTRIDASFANVTRNLRNDAAPSGYEEGTPTSPSFLAYTKSPFMNPYSYGNGVFSDTKLDTQEESYLDEALSLYPEYNYKLGNPYALNEYADGKIKNRFDNSLLNIAVTPKFQFNPYLSLSDHFSYSLVNTNEKYYTPVLGIPSYFVKSVNAQCTNEVRSLASKQNSVQNDARLSWHNRFTAHDISAFAGVRMNFESFTSNSQLGYNTGSDKTPFMSSSLAHAQKNGVDDSWRTVDAYLQANYGLYGKYFLQGNLTATSSSRFGKEAKGGMKLFGVSWGIFPSVQGAWVISNEPWFAKQNVISYLRLTAGFDVSGNDDIDSYASRSYFASSIFLNSKYSGLTFANIGNNTIKWETTRRFNVGIDAKIANRIDIDFNFYKSRTSDLLSLQTLGFLSGIDHNWTNDGKIQNTGFDASMVGKIIANKDWTWQVGASLGHYKNKVISLGDGQTRALNTFYNATILTEVGKPVNLFYGYKTNGVYATTDEALNEGKYILGANGVTKTYFEGGDMRFVDTDGNNEINDDDRVVIGDPNPDIYGNIFTTLTWKRLKLDVNFNYVSGNDVFNYMRSQLEGGSRFMNQTTTMTQRWQVEGQETSVPRISFQDEMGNSRFSDRWIEDGSYIRLKSLILSYDLPLNFQFLQGLQFWVQANNLFTLTHYLGSDPEFTATSSVIGQGIDIGSLGQGRSFVAGIKISL